MVSDLFVEWLGLAELQSSSLDRTEPITKDDALVIIDMQRDFVPLSINNPDGGRFGVALLMW